MLRRSAVAVLAAGAVLAAACGDAVAPPNTFPPGLSEAPRSWQCATATGIVAIAVAEGADDPTGVLAPEGQVITQVAVKVGTDCWPTPEGAAGTYTIPIEGTPCVLVEGLGTPAVLVTRIGTSPACKNVTHVEYVSAPAPQSGLLRICMSLTLIDGTPYLLAQPVTFAVGDVTLALGEANTYVPPLLCAEPIALPAGEHAITALPLYLGFQVFTAPSDRLVSHDPARGTAVVLVVANGETVVTFRSVGDTND